ncbi:MAG: TlpA disulfide reductase family protein [Candidatus Acidiferrales bacterium]
MSTRSRIAVASLGVLAWFTFAISAAAQSVAGQWEGTVVVDGMTIPFRIDISGKGEKLQGAFINGDERVTSTSGRQLRDAVRLNFDQYAEKLNAGLEGDELKGTIEGKFDPGPPSSLPFQAKRFVPQPYPPAGSVPSIGGLWEIEVKSPKGESAWRFIVRQSGADVSAAILRVDGDTGALTGRYRDGKFVLSHFSGERPYVMEAAPKPDGSLAITLNDYNGTRELPAYRPADARAKGLPEPTDPAQHTRVADAQKPLEFRFPDLSGRVVSNTDARFLGKAVLVVITGSWCPNCHDEAPFLADLYRQYRDRGLEIVALDFEEPAQMDDLARLRAFVWHYGIRYTVLVGGDPDDVNKKIPQLVNLNSWPTTVFIGRDGLVKSIHAGFASPASGDFNGQLKAEITARVEALLAVNQPPSQ